MVITITLLFSGLSSEWNTNKILTANFRSPPFHAGSGLITGCCVGWYSRAETITIPPRVAGTSVSHTRIIIVLWIHLFERNHCKCEYGSRDYVLISNYTKKWNWILFGRFLTFEWQPANTILLIMLQCFNAHACLCEYSQQGFLCVSAFGQLGDTFQLFPKSRASTTTSLLLVVKSFLIFPS